MSFTKNLLQVEKFTHKSRLSPSIFLLLIFFIFMPMCNTPEKIKTPPHSFSLDQEEKIALIQFFRELLFDNVGVYTLFGTKPMSIALIQEPPTEQEKADWMAWYDALSLEEKSAIITKKQLYNFAENYQKWQKIKHRFSITQYLFGTFRLDEKTEILLFLNIEMTIRTLLQYYADFQRVFGENFDPFKIVFEVENKDSKFWNMIATQDHALLGILLGYGRENAWFFEWKRKYEKQENPEGNFIRSLPSRFYETRDIKYPDSKHFILPIFESFGLYPHDKHLLKLYKKEHAQIKALYKRQDEVSVVLEWLTR